MSIYELEKPDTSKADISWLSKENDDFDKLMSEFLRKAIEPKYLHWDKVKYFDLPPEVRPIDFWAFVKRARKTVFNPRVSQVKGEEGNYFQWLMLDKYHQWVSEFDKTLAGSFSPLQQADDYKQRIRKVKWTMEESIASAQLEGAHTTRQSAKEMLQRSKKPHNNSEQMIVNSYKTMLALENEFKSVKLDKTVLFQLHEMLVKDTDIKKDAIGRFRNDKENIMVIDDKDGTIYHIPPSEKFVTSEVECLIAYANDEVSDLRFTHPIIKAIIIHFWVGYLHPFFDGNGRLARALFHWYLLKQGYWAISVLPISVMIKKSPAQYGMAYVYSEQDDFDLTYFIDYSMRKLKQAKEHLDKYIMNQKIREKPFQEMAKSQNDFNNRQIQFIIYLLKNKNAYTTIKTHSILYQVGRVTARRDLTRLKDMGYLYSKKVSRDVRYYATDRINEFSTGK